MKQYKEPEIKFISLKPSENIADKCWAYANTGNSPVYYYDLPGTGSLEFQIQKGEGGCDSGIPTKIYYVIDKNGNGTIDNGERKPATEDQKDQLMYAMHTEFGGNSGENTQSTSFEDEFPGWS